jgi:hypothetical protein
LAQYFPKLALALEASGYSMDLWDGEQFRKLKRKNPNFSNPWGQAWDPLADRGEESGSAFIRAIEAFQDDDPAAEIAAYAYGITATLPSIIKAKAEAEGFKVDEIGGFLTALGSRPGRVVHTVINTHLRNPKIYVPQMDKTLRIPSRAILDFGGAALNLNTARSRIRKMEEEKEKHLADPKKHPLLPDALRVDGERRFLILSAFEIATVGAALSTAATLRNSR